MSNVIYFFIERKTAEGKAPEEEIYTLCSMLVLGMNVFFFFMRSRHRGG